MEWFMFVVTGMTLKNGCSWVLWVGDTTIACLILKEPRLGFTVKTASEAEPDHLVYVLVMICD
jgi:hypothetical protein